MLKNYQVKIGIPFVYNVKASNEFDAKNKAIQRMTDEEEITLNGSGLYDSEVISIKKT